MPDHGATELSPSEQALAASIIEQAVSLYAAAARRRAATMTVDDAVSHAVTAHENHLEEVPDHVVARAAELTEDQIDAIESGRGMNRSLAAFTTDSSEEGENA